MHGFLFCKNSIHPWLPLQAKLLVSPDFTDQMMLAEEITSDEACACRWTCEDYMVCHLGEIMVSKVPVWILINLVMHVCPAVTWFAFWILASWIPAQAAILATCLMMPFWFEFTFDQFKFWLKLEHCGTWSAFHCCALIIRKTLDSNQTRDPYWPSEWFKTIGTGPFALFTVGCLLPQTLIL